MKDQHKKIKGYRDLSQEEIDLMNEIKDKAAEVGELCEKLAAASMYLKEIEGPDNRWVAIGTTDLQKGFMALVRSIAKPESF